MNKSNKKDTFWQQVRGDNTGGHFYPLSEWRGIATK